MPTYPYTVTTLADHYEGLDVYAHCNSCRHNAAIDMPALGRKYGWDTPLSDLTPKLKCSACGSRDVGWIVAGFSDPLGSILAKRRAVIEGTTTAAVAPPATH